MQHFLGQETSRDLHISTLRVVDASAGLHRNRRPPTHTFSPVHIDPRIAYSVVSWSFARNGFTSVIEMIAR